MSLCPCACCRIFGFSPARTQSAHPLQFWQDAKEILINFDVLDCEPTVTVEVASEEIFLGGNLRGEVRVSANEEYVEGASVKIHHGATLADAGSCSLDGNEVTLTVKGEGKEVILPELLLPGQTVKIPVLLEEGKAPGGNATSRRKIEAAASGKFRRRLDCELAELHKVGLKEVPRVRGFCPISEVEENGSVAIALMAEVAKDVTVTGYRLLCGTHDVTDCIARPKFVNDDGNGFANTIGNGCFLDLSFFVDDDKLSARKRAMGASEPFRIAIDFVEEDGLGGSRKAFGSYTQVVPLKLATLGGGEAARVVRKFLGRLEASFATVSSPVGFTFDASCVCKQHGEQGNGNGNGNGNSNGLDLYRYEVRFDKKFWRVIGKVKGGLLTDCSISMRAIPLVAGTISIFPSVCIFKRTDSGESEEAKKTAEVAIAEGFIEDQAFKVLPERQVGVELSYDIGSI